VKKILFEGKFKRLVIENGWEYVERINCKGIVVVIALTEDENIILVEQHRIPVGSRCIEFPAGLTNDQKEFANESLAEAARRELLEETGYEAGQLTQCMQGPVSSAASGDIITIFRATQLVKQHEGGGDHTEDITVHVVPLNKVNQWLMDKQKQGCMIDPKVYGGLYWLQNGLV